MTTQDYVDNAGFVPAKTTDPAEAFLCWCVDGAAILRTERSDPEALVEASRSIFGAHLPPDWPGRRPGAVATNTADPAREGFDRDTRTLLSAADKLLDVHNDGALGYGDVYPNLLVLLCASTASSGGESFLVDGQYLLDGIARDTAQRELSRFLWGTPIEQCARAVDRPAGALGQIRSRRPVASRTAGGRVTVRFNREHQRVLDEGPVAHSDRAQLARWHDIGLRAAVTAPRFLLQQGELLIVDNYRVFHGREPYRGSDRYFHRAQGFTDMSFQHQAELLLHTG